jgi:hypothetical protein
MFMAKKKSGSTNAADRLKRNIAALDRIHAASKIDPMPPAKPPGRGSPQFVLRYSPEMRDQIARLAKANGRSINAELIALLERALSSGDDVEQLQTSMGEIFDRVGEIFDRVEKLESLVSDHDDQLNNRDDPANED